MTPEETARQKIDAMLVPFGGGGIPNRRRSRTPPLRHRSNRKKIGTSLKQAERLRQSILKKAFAGKLVPQDPTDEPADKLLERIRAARESNHNTQPKQLLLLNGSSKKTRRRKQ